MPARSLGWVRCEGAGVSAGPAHGVAAYPAHGGAADPPSSHALANSDPGGLLPLVLHRQHLGLACSAKQHVLLLGRCSCPAVALLKPACTGLGSQSGITFAAAREPGRCSHAMSHRTC